MTEREIDNSLPGDKTVVQSVLGRKTDRVLNEGDDVVVCLPGATNTVDKLEGRKHHGFGQGWICFSTHMNK